MRELIYDNVRIQFFVRRGTSAGSQIWGIFHGSEYALDSGQGAFEKAGKEAAGKSKADPGKIRAGSKAWW